MKHQSRFRFYLIIGLVFISIMDFSCKKKTPITGPNVVDDEEYSIALEVYRTGADFLAADDYGDASYANQVLGIVGRGGILMVKNPDFERFVAVYTGVANNLTYAGVSSETYTIAGMGLGLYDPGIILERGKYDLYWTTQNHPARGGITDLSSRCAVTSTGEIMTNDSGTWAISFEDVDGPGFSGAHWAQGRVTAVGSSGRIFRNPTAHDYSDFSDETIPGGPDFSAVRYQFDNTGGLGAIWTAVGGREIWQRVSGNWSRVLDGVAGDLYDVNSNGSITTIYAVGANGTIIEKRVESGWAETSVGADVTFRGVSGHGTLACGEDGAIYFNDPSNGWTDAGYANLSTWNDFDGLSSDEIYAANGDTLMSWDGISWNPLATIWGGEIISLHVVSSSRIWIVNSDGFDNFVQLWNGSMFNISNQSSMDAFNSIWSDASVNKTFVAADNGYIFFLDGFWDMVMADPSGRNFYDIYGTSDQDVYAVGEEGLISHFDGSTWTDMSTGVKEHTLRAIDGLVAVGDNGLVLRRSGSSWLSEKSGTTAHLYSVCYLSDKDIWAAGEGSQIIHYDGSKWQVYQRPLMTVDINTVWADVSSPNDVWFGGEQGFLLKNFLP